MTHGHRQQYGDRLREEGAPGGDGEKGQKWDNCNRIHNKI